MEKYKQQVKIVCNHSFHLYNGRLVGADADKNEATFQCDDVKLVILVGVKWFRYWHIEYIFMLAINIWNSFYPSQLSRKDNNRFWYFLEFIWFMQTEFH